MKSKLFLSLSLLTAVFSVTLQAVSPAEEAAHTAAWIAHANPQLAIKLDRIHTAKVLGFVLAPIAGVAGLAACADYLVKKPEVKSLTYAQQAQQMIQNGYNAVKANAVKGYELAKANPKTTGGIAAAVLAAGYLAYNSDLFGKSKAVVVAPVSKPVVKSAKQRLNAF